ncbi:hypothetical protein BH10BAC6_BH10BAC6_12500 [soil metagenome]
MNEQFYIMHSEPQVGIKSGIHPMEEYDEIALAKGEYVPSNQPWPVSCGKGTRWKDVVKFTNPFNIAVSAAFKKVLDDNGFSGWKAIELDILDDPDRGYFCLQVVGRSGPVDRPEVAGYVDGMKFDHQTWDGSDIFIPDGTVTILCTKRVRDAFVSTKLTKLSFVDINEHRWFSGAKKA